MQFIEGYYATIKRHCIDLKNLPIDTLKWKEKRARKVIVCTNIYAINCICLGKNISMYWCVQPYWFMQHPS